MTYADYAFYTEEYFGNAISEEDFPRLSSRASDYIYANTQGIAETVIGKDLEMVKKATCAIAEVILDEEILEASAFSGGQSVSSESVGSWSKSYSKSDLSAEQVDYLNQRKQECLWIYLGSLPAFASLFRVTSFRCVPGGH